MRHGSLPVLAATFLVGCLLDLPIALLTAPSVPSFSQVSYSAWLALAFLTLFITPVNLACQNLALRSLDASQVANFSNVSPILTVCWGSWLFGEAITASLVAGGALTLAGVFWTGGAPGRAVRGQWSVVRQKGLNGRRVLTGVSTSR
jgi:drug/metabolite transporter (DMT)-like permease